MAGGCAAALALSFLYFGTAYFRDDMTPDQKTLPRINYADPAFRCVENYYDIAIQDGMPKLIESSSALRYARLLAANQDSSAAAFNVAAEIERYREQWKALRLDVSTLIRDGADKSVIEHKQTEIFELRIKMRALEDEIIDELGGRGPEVLKKCTDLVEGMNSSDRARVARAAISVRVLVPELGNLYPSMASIEAL